VQDEASSVTPQPSDEPGSQTPPSQPQVVDVSQVEPPSVVEPIPPQQQVCSISNY